jgi:hypothetical protein
VTHQHIKQQIIYANESEKNQASFDLIFSDSPQHTLAFTNSKVKCDMADEALLVRIVKDYSQSRSSGSNQYPSITKCC